MLQVKVLVIFALVAVGSASPTKPAFWKGTSLDSTVEEMRSLCAEDDPIACLKFKAISFLDFLLQRDSYQISDDIEVSRNNYQPNEITSRSSENSLEDKVENYIKSHDVSVKLPISDSKITLGARNLDNDEINLKLNFGGQVEGRKSKLKKIVIPILVFVLLKAMTLVPLALGVLGLKAWNALQLSFFSFLVAVGLAIFQLCKKIAAEHAPPQIAAHPPWDAAYAARSLGVENQKIEPEGNDAQAMAYSAYVQN